MLVRPDMCLGPDSNRGPFPLQGNALPTELPKQYGHSIIARPLFHLPISDPDTEPYIAAPPFVTARLKAGRIDWFRLQESHHP
jgi:hypothetical protein